MHEFTLKQLWQNSGANLEAHLAPASDLRAAMTATHIKSGLNRMRPTKIFALLAGLLWVFSVGGWVLALAHGSPVNWFLVGSLGAQVLLTGMALGMYAHQLYLIRRVDVSRPVLDAQEHLYGLKTSTLGVARLLFLQLPLWTTFYWNETMLRDWSAWQWAIQVGLTLAFTAAAVWLFVQIRYENRHQKWFRLLFRGREWAPLLEALDGLEQVRAYREDAH